MTVLNMQNAEQALKINYLPALRYQLNVSNPILAVIERDSESVVGSEIRMALRFGRQGGVGNRADDGLLPIPNSRKTKQAKYETKNIFAHIQISDKTMKASRSRDGAFVSLLEAELEDAMNDAKDNMARQVFGNGSGIMATVTTAANDTTFEVDNVQYLVEGQIVDFVDTTTETELFTQKEIVSVDDVANTVTISGAAIDVPQNVAITIHGNYKNELTGLKAIFTPDTKIYDIDRSVHKWFNPVVDAVNGAISEVGIQKNIDEVDRKAGGKTNFLSASYGVRRAYQDLLLATKRTTDVMKLKGGFEVLTYNGMPFTVDKYNPAGTLYGLDLSTLRLYHIEDWSWLAEDGAVLHRAESRPVWTATLARYCDLGNSKIRGNFVMTGLDEE